MTFEEAYQQIRENHYKILDERESISKSARLSLSTWILDILTECREADTPQTDCETCRHYKLACELFSEVCKYEPITQTETQNSNLTFDTPQTDCQW